MDTHNVKPNEYLDALEDEGTMENWCKGEEGKAMQNLGDIVQTSIIRDPVDDDIEHIRVGEQRYK